MFSLSKINHLLSGEGLEFECRFQNVNIETFKRVLNSLEKPISEEIIEERSSGTVKERNGQYITKERLFEDFNRDYDFPIKFSLSRETNISKPALFVPNLIRKKRRFTKIFQNVKADFTEVNGEDYEIELEIISSISELSLNELNGLIIMFLKLLLDTNFIYTKVLRETTLKNYYNYLGKPVSKTFRGGDLVQARNLEKRDLVYGGLIGPDVNYSVCKKLDGLRKVLMIDGDNLWYFSNNSTTLLDIKPEFSKFSGTILDGEDIPEEARYFEKRFKYIYLPFDILSFNRDFRIQRQTHYERLLKAMSVEINSSYIKILFKEFIFLDQDPNTLFNSVRKLLTSENQIKTDGLMFTPNEVNYQSDENLRRPLTEYKCICKWKPENLLTIDFLINPSEKKVYVSNRGSLSEFPITVNWETLKGISDGTVCELSPTKKGEEIIFTLHRIRSDKPIPNSLHTAEDVLKNIKDPVTEKTLLGESFDLLFRYHNRIKRDLFADESIEKGSYLVEIGSGRFGDMSKLGSFSRIVSIEPDRENIKEAQKRLKEAGLESKYRIVNSKFEDTEVILPVIREFLPKTPYVSAMLCLSFFFLDENSYKGFLRSFKEITLSYPDPIRFLFLTINGEKVKELFKEKGNEVHLGICKLSWDGKSNGYHIDIKDSIVSNYFEGFVNLERLKTDLSLKVKKYLPATEEKLLNDNEKIFTSLFDYGIFEYSQLKKKFTYKDLI